MKKRNRKQIAVCLCLCLFAPFLSALAQQPVAPDQKAYRGAIAIKDPQKKLAALEKFVAEYPESFSVGFAGVQMIETLLKIQPLQKDKIAAKASQVVEMAEQSPVRAYVLQQVAANLLKAELYEEAERVATKAIAATDEQIAQVTANYRKGKAQPLAIIGQAHFKRGDLKEAEKVLKEAFALNPQEPDVAATLADISEQRGKEADAINYLLAAGRLKAEQRKKLEDLWRKRHNGTLDGLEAELDARYEKDYSHLVPVTRYQPTPRRSNRAVLAEVFTGSGCPPCVAADLAFDALMERYSRQEMIVLMYHQHIPRPDPMANPATVARSKYYSVQGVPSYTFDGQGVQSGGGDKESTKNSYGRFNSSITKRLEVPADATLKLNAGLENGVVKVVANVSLDQAAVERMAKEAQAEAGEAAKAKEDKAKPNEAVNAKADGAKAKEDAAKEEKASVDVTPSYKLHIVLVEEKLRYPGENGIRIHPLVVRAMAGADAKGFTLDPAKNESVTASFDLSAISAELKKYLDDFETKEKEKDEKFAFSEKKYQIDPGNLSVVAFVQEEKSKKVLQSAIVRVGGVLTKAAPSTTR